jgi:hypothetical protein
MRWVELDFEDWDRCRDKNKNRDRDKLVSDVECIDDERFSEALIRNAEIREIENVNEQIDAI